MWREETIGDCRLILGDCLEVLPTLESVDLVLTDPPYGVRLSNHARGKERRDMDWTIIGDDSQEVGQSALDFIAGKAWPCLAFAAPMRPWAGDWRQHLVWEKGEHVSGGGDPATCWKPSWELLQVARTGELAGRRDGAVLRFQAIKDDYAHHPSPKPVALLSYLLHKTTSRGERVLDPFAGSGSTGVACARLGRHFVGIEIDQKHFTIACRRIEQAYSQPDMLVEAERREAVQQPLFDGAAA